MQRKEFFRMALQAWIAQMLFCLHRNMSRPAPWSFCHIISSSVLSAIQASCATRSACTLEPFPTFLTLNSLVYYSRESCVSTTASHLEIQPRFITTILCLRFERISKESPFLSLAPLPHTHELTCFGMLPWVYQMSSLHPLNLL